MTSVIIEVGALIVLIAVEFRLLYYIYSNGMHGVMDEIANGISSAMDEIIGTIQTAWELLVWGRGGRPQPPTEAEKLRNQYANGELTLDELEDKIDDKEILDDDFP